MDKNQAFEYFVSKLIEWYQEVNGGVQINDLSTLKVLKLLFFNSAIDAQKGENNTLLDNPFNKFYAMPYGHVESDIYNSIRQEEFQNLKIDNSSSIFVNPITFPECEIRNKIDASISKLKNENVNLINMTSFQLVELSHSWYSWKFYYSKAKKNGSYSELIPNEIIKSELKFYQL